MNFQKIVFSILTKATLWRILYVEVAKGQPKTDLEKTMNRIEIANELLNGVEDCARADHEIIANMILNGTTKDEILDSKEANNWPDTYSWLSNNL